MKALRPAIVRLFKQGRPKKEISRLLDVPPTTVRDTIRRFEETGNYEDRPGRGRKKSQKVLKACKSIKRRVQTNPKLSTRKLSKTIGIPRSTVQQILQTDLGLKSYKFRRANMLTAAMKASRLKRAKALKVQFAAGRHRAVLFSDEKLFTIEQAHNAQNDRVWAKETPSYRARWCFGSCLTEKFFF